VHGDLAVALAAAGVCGAVVTVGEPATIPLLRRAAAIDTPNLRSSHTVPTPRGGGAPIAAGLLLAAPLIRSPLTIALAAAVAAFAAIGMADDLAGLSAGRRLGMQLAAGLTAGWALAAGDGIRSAAAAAVAAGLAVWITAFVSAFTFMDGVNGISGVHALIGGACYAGLGLWHRDALLAAGGAAVAAGAAAFLPWNAVRARVFLGDVGSYGLGAALAVLAAAAVADGLPPEAVAAPLALYLADTGWALQRRIRAGEPWLQAHRTHAYQRLCDAGWSHPRVALGTGAVSAAVCLLGAASLAGPLPGAAAGLAAVALLAAYLRLPAWLGHPPASPARTADAVSMVDDALPVPALRPAGDRAPGRTRQPGGTG
jgi:UDP-GlcNAc:undecaprenyl-phosphate GlcNAc-1-phosphate transferase